MRPPVEDREPEKELVRVARGEGRHVGDSEAREVAERRAPDRAEVAEAARVGSRRGPGTRGQERASCSANPTTVPAASRAKSSRAP